MVFNGKKNKAKIVSLNIFIFNESNSVRQNNKAQAYIRNVVMMTRGNVPSWENPTFEKDHMKMWLGTFNSANKINKTLGAQLLLIQQ